LKEINNQLETTVTQKMRQQIQAKEALYDELCNKTTKDLFNMRQECDSKVKTLTDGFSRDISIIYDELTGERK